MIENAKKEHETRLDDMSPLSLPPTPAPPRPNPSPKFSKHTSTVGSHAKYIRRVRNIQNGRGSWLSKWWRAASKAFRISGSACMVGGLGSGENAAEVVEVPLNTQKNNAVRV